MAVVLLILLISLLVLVHELGHFLAAKRAGVHVEEFGLGIPPRLFGKKIGETLYSINLLPFGGFVKLTGEDAPESGDSALAGADPHNFLSKNAFTKLAILGFGVLMNFLFAILLYYVFFFSVGYKSLALPVFFDYKFRFGDQKVLNTVVNDTQPDGPAQAAGLLRGEAIIEIDDKPVYSVDDIKKALIDKADTETKVLLLDVTKLSGGIRTVKVVAGGDGGANGLLGVFLSKAIILDYSQNPWLSAPMHAYNILGYSVDTLVNLVGLSAKTKDLTIVSQSVSGPVGVFSVIDGILLYAKDELFLRLVDLTALLSLTIAFVNILPFPALDGGRILFVVLEILTGKKINPLLEARIHKWGMIALLGLLFLVTFKDVKNIIG